MSNETDLLYMNPVYLAFSLFQSRQGGSHAGWNAIIRASGAKKVKEYVEFENELMEHTR